MQRNDSSQIRPSVVVSILDYLSGASLRLVSRLVLLIYIQVSLRLRGVSSAMDRHSIRKLVPSRRVAYGLVHACLGWAHHTACLRIYGWGRSDLDKSLWYVRLGLSQGGSCSKVLSHGLSIVALLISQVVGVATTLGRIFREFIYWLLMYCLLIDTISVEFNLPLGWTFCQNAVRILNRVFHRLVTTRWGCNLGHACKARAFSQCVTDQALLVDHLDLATAAILRVSLSFEFTAKILGFVLGLARIWIQSLAWHR